MQELHNYNCGHACRNYFKPCYFRPLLFKCEGYVTDEYDKTIA
jgi:hypothetical protein